MAAKVVMVAVPTVMGIASIRVYTVSDVPTDGLVSRQKLNIYTPLPQSAQAQFVPESPGVIQSGVTAARETVLPLVQAVKGACFSVKTGTVNLYHAGEDVYYYLKDPPPGFLPRFGTITMAGLLGMFLARKGSHFKRLAVPLGLMSAGASVCYPAQTVAVLKVTGKKVYAVGQWSSAAVSSLLPSKSQEPVAKEIAASPPQTATVPKPECAGVEEASESSLAQSSSIPETEVESAESVPLSDEPVVTVITEEASTVTLTETSSDQATNTDPVAHSVPAETEATTVSEEIPAPVESEEPSDTKQAAEDVSISAQPTQCLEPTTVEAAPVESVPVEAAPVESVPVEALPAEALPVEAAPVEAAPVESVLVEAAPVESVPVESVPVEAAPVESVLVESVPVESVPVESVPVEAAPVESVPVEAAPVESGLVEAAPVESVLVEAAPVEAAPVEAAPVEAAPVESAPVEAAPVESAPVEAAPVEAAPVESAEVESVPSFQESPAPKALDEAEVPVVESAEPEPAAQPELAEPPQVAALEETPTPTLTPPSPQQHAAENSKGGSSFKPDPALMDFGQSNPEDEDLYSTRS